jgi:hypothetical protein
MRLCQNDLFTMQAANTTEVAPHEVIHNILSHLLHPPIASHLTQDSVVTAATTYLRQQQEHADSVALANLMADHRQHIDSIQRLQQDLRAVQQLDSFHQNNNIALVSSLSRMDRGSHQLIEDMLRRSRVQNGFAGETPRPDATLLLSNHMTTSSTTLWNHHPSMTCLTRRNSNNSIPISLPVCLAHMVDAFKLSDHQYFLRQQIEVFQASSDDVSTHIRGRNKPITLGQVGIRCRHCAHLPIARRQKGSTYFPANKLGIYQAAQNMSTSHIQCGLCSEMPESIKLEFVRLLVEKGQSCHARAGRPYWSKSATALGLVDTEDSGIRFIPDLPPGALEMPK